MKKRVIKIICVCIVACCLLMACGGPNNDMGYEKESSVTNSKSLSLSERKELVKQAVLRDISSNTWNSGKFYHVRWSKSRYSIEISQTGESFYRANISLSLYDQYENLLARSKKGEITADITMTPEGVIKSCLVYHDGLESSYIWK